MPKVVPTTSPPSEAETEIQIKDYIRDQISLIEKNKLYMLYKEHETEEQRASMKIKQEKHLREKFDLAFPRTKE